MLNELKLCEVAWISFSNRCWKFQLSILKNKKVLFLKKNFGRCQYQNKQALFADPIFSEGFDWKYQLWFSRWTKNKESGHTGYSCHYFFMSNLHFYLFIFGQVCLGIYKKKHRNKNDFASIKTLLDRIQYTFKVDICTKMERILYVRHSGQKVLLVNHDCKESLVIMWSTQTLFNIY